MRRGAGRPPPPRGPRRCRARPRGRARRARTAGRRRRSRGSPRGRSRAVPPPARGPAPSPRSAARAPGPSGPCRAARAGRRRAPTAAASRPGAGGSSASAANAITLVLASARSAPLSTTADVAIAASPTAWPRIDPLWSTSRHSARRGAVQRRAISWSACLGLPAGNLKAQVEVEVTLSPGLAGAQPPVAAAGARAEPPGADEQARGEPPGLGAQLRVGRRAEVGQQRDGGVGVGAQQVVEGRLVEPADRGRDLLELPVRARELVAAQRPPAALLDDVARRGPAQRTARSAREQALGFSLRRRLRLGVRLRDRAARSARARSPRASCPSPPRAAAGRRARRSRRRRTWRPPARARPRRAGR